MTSQSADGTGEPGDREHAARDQFGGLAQRQVRRVSEPGTDSVKTGADIWYAPLDGSAPPRVFVVDLDLRAIRGFPLTAAILPTRPANPEETRCT